MTLKTGIEGFPCVERPFRHLPMKASEPENTSGIHPIEYKALVLLDPVETVTKGGIHLLKSTVEREQAAAVDGVLIAMGAWAFSVDGNPWPDKPSIGDRVTIAKYAGLERVIGDKTYRLIADKDVVAVLR